MVIISGINVSWALKINLTEERKLLANVAVTTNFVNNLYATKPKKASNKKRWVETICTRKRRSIILKPFNELWIISARYLRQKTAGDILRSVQIRYNEHYFQMMDKDQSGAGQNVLQFTFISQVITYWKWILIFGVIRTMENSSKLWFFFSNVLDCFTLSFELDDIVILLNGCYIILYKLVRRICGTSARLPTALIGIVTGINWIVTQRCLE